ncbi:MAG: PAS domain-containing protein [Lysobacterales bacterium]|nr:MAG: PAS domain-containing protein [Xanthomonadales bacterium]
MRRPLLRSVSVAFSALAAALALRWLLDPVLGSNTPFTLVMAVVVLATLLGGPWLGVLIAVVAYLATDYLFLAPRWDIGPTDPRTVAMLQTYVVACVIVVAAASVARVAWQREARRRQALQVTMASLADGVVTIDVGAGIVAMNAAAERMTGWSESEARGRPVDEVVRLCDEANREDVPNPVHRAIRERRAADPLDHTLLVSRTWGLRNVESVAAPILGADGTVGGAVLILRDNTVKRTAERNLELREREARERLEELQAIYTTAPVGLCLVDRDLRFRRINEHLAEMNGLPAEDHVGRTIGEVVPELARIIEPELHRVIETGEPRLEFEVVGRTAAQPGVERTWIESWHPFRDGAGHVIGVNITVYEVTDRKRAERRIGELIEELRLADRRKDEFIAILAHELRNPLASIRSSIDALKLAPTPGLPGVVERSERQVRQLTRLVDDLLDLNRMARTDFELHREPVDVATIVQRAAEGMRHALEAGPFRLDLVLPSQPCRVLADEARLVQVVGNLIDNACKYGRAGGTVRVVVESAGERVLVRVVDDGIGIPSDQIPGLFDLFVQVERPGKDGRGGLGIGLMLVKRLVELHGGTVSAHSAGVGSGSEFVIELPALPGVPAGGERERGSVQGFSARRVLIADDNADAADSLALLVRMTGNEVEIARDGIEAVELAERSRPDVILLDIGMPRLDGYGACRRIRALPWGHEPLVIAVTGWGGTGDRRRADEAGFDAHAVKPIELADLAGLVAELQADRTRA